MRFQKVGTDCITCFRWKMFNDKACSAHPNFETQAEQLWKQAQENLDVLMLTAALRVYGYMGLSSKVNFLVETLAVNRPDILKKVVAEIEKLGPMTDAEYTTSLMMGLQLNKGK